MAGVLPPNTSYFMQRLQGFSSSHFKVLPQTTGDMQASSIIRFELPSNSYINFGKGGLRMFFKAKTAGSGGRLPNGLDKLIERIAIYAGGTLIQNNFNGYNVLRAAKEALGAPKLCASTGHPDIVRTKSYHDGSSITGTSNEAYTDDNDCFCIDMWEGFLGSVAPSIIDLGLLPQITIEITLAANAVCSTVAGVALDGTGTSDITDKGTGSTYTLSDLSLQVEVIGMASSVLDEIAEQRISSVGYLSLPFKNYFTSVSSHTGSTRFSVNSASLDRIWICYRDSTYSTQNAAHRVPGFKKTGAFVSTASASYTGGFDVGLPDYDLGGALDTNREKYISEYLRFQEKLSSATDVATYSLQINGASVPAYKMNRVEALAMTKGAVEAYGKVDDTLTLNQYINSYFVQCYRFCLPESEYSRTASGLDTRSVSAICSLETENLSDCHVTIISECSSELRVGSGRAISVIQ